MLSGMVKGGSSLVMGLMDWEWYIVVLMGWNSSIVFDTIHFIIVWEL
jgi:hypothetical protein